MNMTTTTKEILSPNFAVFNLHINDAESKAKQAFVKRFAQETFDSEIQPFIDKGIMSIFNTKPTEHTRWYVEAVGIFVNQ